MGDVKQVGIRGDNLFGIWMEIFVKLFFQAFFLEIREGRVGYPLLLSLPPPLQSSQPH